MSAFSLTVFGVQPLRLERSEHVLAYADAMLADRNGIEDVETGEVPPWVEALEKLYPNRHFCYRRLDRTAVDLDGLTFRLDAWLCSNTVLNQHLVLFELQTESVDPAAVDPQRLRAALVRPDDGGADDRRPPAVRRQLTRACEQIARRHAEIGRSDPYGPEDITVDPNSCNVTLFLHSCQVGCIKKAEDGTLALDLKAYTRDKAERVSADRIELSVSDDTRVYFGGRVHHVVSSSADDVHVIKHMMLMLQVVWYFVPRYLREAAWCHRQILGRDAGYDLDKLEWAAKRLIHVYQTIHLQNEFAKYAYGALCGVVYDPCERRWNVERSVGQFESYAEFFRAFIKDAREIQSRKSDRMLNYVLAGLGLFGIVGLWADILDSQVSAHDIKSYHHLWSMVTGSALGFTTVVFIVAAALVATALAIGNVRIRRGRSAGARRLPLRRKPRR